MNFFNFVFLFILSSSALLGAMSDHFVTTWKTDNPGTSNSSSITIPTAGLGYSYQVDWNNDGDFLDTDENIVYTDDVTHDFGTPGIYTIRIAGRFPRIYFNNRGDKEKILSIDQWGTITWKSMGRAFYGAKNLTLTATDTPNFSAVTDMQYMFNGATLANPDTTHWDTSQVTNMRYMFARTANASPNTSHWDTSQVTNMSYMFYFAKVANPNTSSWDTSRVTSMRSMFRGALQATPDTTTWNTSAVTDMALMFRDTTLANPDTSNWDISRVTDLSYMFYKAQRASPNTSRWNTASVTDMRYLFAWSNATNLDTSNWDTGNVTKMQYMFYKASAANPDTTRWNIAKVTDMRAMFTDVTLRTPHYDAMLSSFAAQNIQSNVIFGGGNATYCSSEAERNYLITTQGWSITDGGRDCSPITPTRPPDLQESSDTGISSSDNNTSDETPIIDLECLRVGNSLTLYSNNPNDGTVLATHLCTTLGIVSVTSNRLALGAHTLTYTDANTTDISLPSPPLYLYIMNDAPVATDNNYTLHEDSILEGNVISDGIADSDVDGDNLHVNFWSTPLHGTLLMASDGTFTYTPYADFYGRDRFNYRISDGNGAQANASVTLTITPQNDAPVIAEGATLLLNGNEDTIFTTLLHASDRDGDLLHWRIQSEAQHGSVVIDPLGNTATLTYIPQANYFGSDRVKVSVSDANVTQTITLTLNIVSVNDIPVARDDSAAVYANSAVTVAVLANDYDDDNDTLSLIDVSTPMYGHATIVGDVILYTANPNVNAVDSFFYTLSDAHGGSATAHVTITVTTMDEDGIDEPEGVDNDHNGEEDRFESHVATQQFQNDFITLATQNSAILRDVTFTTTPHHATTQEGSTIVLPYGTVSFRVTDIEAGGTATLTLYYPKDEQIEGYAKHLDDGSWHLLESTVTHTTTQTIVRFSITDGSIFDLDEISAQITDPGGVYYRVTTPIAVPLSPYSIALLALLLFLGALRTLYSKKAALT